jgi:predicted HD phosphohydrolase
MKILKDFGAIVVWFLVTLFVATVIYFCSACTTPRYTKSCNKDCGIGLQSVGESYR